MKRVAFAQLTLVLMLLSVNPVAAAPADGPTKGPWPMSGVNLSLFPSGLNRHDTADVASGINRLRVDQAKAAGFGFIRLGIPFDAWTSKVDPAEQTRVLSIVAATVHEAMVKGVASVLAHTPDSPTIAIEAINEPPSCPGDNGAKSVWAGEQPHIYKIVRRRLPNAVFVVTGPKWGNVLRNIRKAIQARGWPCAVWAASDGHAPKPDSYAAAELTEQRLWQPVDSALGAFGTE